MRLLFLIFLVFTHLGYSQITNGDTKSNETSIYDGTIGSFPIHMELTNQSGQIIGWYDYPGKSTKLRIEGTVNSDGSIDFNEYNYKAQHTGHFSGNISDDQSISGQWNNPDFTKNLMFSLNLTNNIPLITKLDAASERKMFKESRVKGYSKLALWTTIGLILIISAVVYNLMRAKRKLKEKPQVIIEKRVEVHHVNGNLEDELSISTKKGQMFEKHVVQKFHNKEEYYKLVRGTNDKDYGGIYAESNSDPDLILRYKNSKQGWEEEFAVECKYRSGYDFGTKVFIDKPYKIENYKRYKEDKKMQVFIALGIGGTADNPAETYVLPIEIVNGEYMDRSELFNFKNKYNYFYFDYLKKTLN